MIQVAVNSIITASVLALIGTSFALQYHSGRFFNLALASMLAIGAYSVYVVRILTHFSLFPAILIGIAITACLGVIIEVLVYTPIRRSRPSSLTLLLVSLGVYGMLEGVLCLIFGGDIRSLRSGLMWYPIRLADASITNIQLWSVATGVCILFCIGLLLSATRMGLVIRAVAARPDLAATCGVELNLVHVGVAALSSTLIALAGVLWSLDADILPTMGLYPLLMGIVVALIGGTVSVPGIVLGAIVLGLVTHWAGWVLGAAWQDPFAFAILAAFLLFRPQGFMGRKVKKATV